MRQKKGKDCFIAFFLEIQWLIVTKSLMPYCYVVSVYYAVFLCMKLGIFNISRHSNIRLLLFKSSYIMRISNNSSVDSITFFNV